MAVVTVRHGYPEDFGDRYDAIKRSYGIGEWDRWRIGNKYGDCGTSDTPFPHCDSDILHAPGECAVCDLYPSKQKARILEQVAFTGHEPLPSQQPCPADARRPPDSSSWHGRWHGNIAQ